MKSRDFDKWFNEFMNGNSVKMKRSMSKKEFIDILNEYCESDDDKVILMDNKDVLDVVYVRGGGFRNKETFDKCVFITVAK